MRHIITFILLTIFLPIFSQTEEPTETATPDKFDFRNLRAADNLMKMNSYYNAIEKYKDFYQKYPDHETVGFKLGFAYYITRDYKSAVTVFSEYFQNKKLKKDPRAYYYYAQSLKSEKRYADAYKAFADYTMLKDKSEHAKTYNAFARNEIAAYDWIKTKLKEDSTEIHFARLLGNMNRAYSDFSPQPIHHDTLVFASLATDSIVTYNNFDTEFNTIKLYEITREDSGTWSQPFELEEYNNQFQHTANGVLSPDGKYFYFTRCLPDRNNDIICNIYYVEYDNDKIKQHKPKEVKGLNLSGYTSTQPTFQMSTRRGKGGKIDTLMTIYFVSNRPKSRGLDLWFAPMEHHGKFKDPRNCGTIINTLGDEVTPYFDNRTNKLYFSSNFHFGFGGQDIFSSEGTQNRWTKPQNLLFPTNSSYDDTYYIPVKHKKFVEEAGFIVSNRPGGIALHSETCCDDIYYYKDNIKTTVKLKGRITTEVPSVQRNATADSLRKKHFTQLKALSEIDTNVTASNFKKYYKRAYTKADSSIVNKSKLKKSLLGLDTTQFAKYDTLSLKQPVGKTKIGTLKKSTYAQLVALGDTSFASLKEHVTWVDTTDENSDFDLDIKKDKDYLFVFNNDKNKTKIQKINIDEDSTVTIVMDKIIVLPVDTPKTKINNNLSTNIQKLTEGTTSESLFVLDNLYFDFDSDVIKDESRPVLQLLLTFLNKNTTINMEIMGHTDSRGSDEHNLDLSQRRAEAVMNWLVANEIQEKRLTAKGYGETKPVLPNENPDGSDNPENRAKNRRTEVKIIKTK